MSALQHSNLRCVSKSFRYQLFKEVQSSHATHYKSTTPSQSLMKHPNVLWMVSDHQAFANRKLNIEYLPLQKRLGEIGTTFRRAYTVLPICSPARASMLTGLYPHMHGLTENDGRFGGRAELDVGEALLQRDFRAAGYRCGWFGKWHLNHDTSACDHGFEGFSLPGYGYPYNTPEYKAYLSSIQSGPLFAEIEVPGESRLAPATQVDLLEEDSWYDYEAGSAILHGPEEVHEAHFLADAAIRWIKSVDRTHPFFVRLDPWGPHPPYTVPSGFQSEMRDEDVFLSHNLDHDLETRPAHHAQYRDQWQRDLREDSFDWPRLTRRAIEHSIVVERALKKVIDFLEDCGRIENTIIVFCADHGDAVASNGGVMNKGSLLTEETIRIPMVFAGPSIARGKTTDALIANVDVAPTLLDLCDLTPSSTHQGLSVEGQLHNPRGSALRDKIMVQHYGLHIPIVQRCLVQSNWKYVLQEDGFEELYRLDADPYERTNLAIEDPNASAILNQLRSGLRKEMESLGDNQKEIRSVLDTLSE
ncbi:sulfatase-like hydrolase/transferase [Aliisedimentitalea scapharcae]|uniref:Sulfatase-like hydrolase/transferase n=1 Tax=Aliisedimentitalea scapharcae TaxID=1524259 RepID=A0ABZ2XXT8_9RHOB